MMMFSVGEKALDSNGRIFVIEKTEDKDFGSGPTPYFVLKPAFPYEFKEGYRSFVPVEKAGSILRPLMSREQCLTLVESIPGLESYDSISPRERKVFFTKVIAGGDRKEMCKVIKTLVNSKREKAKIHKPLSDFDNNMLTSLSSFLSCEMSLSLNISEAEAMSLLRNKVGMAY